MLAVALLLGSALAGCSASPSNASSGDALDLGSVPIEAGSSTGAIRGVVVDEAIRPLAKAHISFGSRNVTADDQGRFSFADVTPGTVFLKVTAKGYLSVQTSAVVEAGKIVDVRVALAADLNPQPYHQTLQLKGFIQASGGIATYALDLLANDTGVTLCPTCTLYFQNDPSVTTIVNEAVWTESIPMPSGPAQFYWEIELSGSDAGHIESDYSASPVFAHVDAQKFWGNETHLQSRLTGPFEWPEYNQEYRLFVTLFHVAPAPTAWPFVKGDI